MYAVKELEAFELGDGIDYEVMHVLTHSTYHCYKQILAND